jgi:DNA (cytosine-5)-methyltransferase 1
VPIPARPESSRDRRFLSLFSGAGGLDLGMEKAGWKPVAAIEMDTDAVRTLELAARRMSKVGDGPEPIIVPKKIEDVPPSRLRLELGLRKRELALMAGGPPCQPFTTHGLRQSITDVRAAGIWPAYLGYVDEFQPKALVIENVDGLLSAALRHRPLALRGSDRIAEDPRERKGSFLLWLLNELSARGYTVTWGVAEAADYGVPQFRQRSIIIGVRGSVPCFLPPREFGSEGQPPYRTLRQALEQVSELGAIQPLSERKRAVYAQIPPGGNWRDLPELVQRETMGRAHLATGGKSGWWRRLAWDSPTPTILGMPDHSSTSLVHPEETRCLSVTECAAAQSFPPDVEFAGSPRSQYQQIGNAVPPLLGYAIGKQLVKHFSGAQLELPPVPKWRKASANRRIGTHGWVVVSRNLKSRLTLNVKVRHDHVWAALTKGNAFDFTSRAN